jgi:hypothetical protein
LRSTFVVAIPEMSMSISEIDKFHLTDIICERSTMKDPVDVQR